MSRKMIDISGQDFNYWHVIGPYGKDSRGIITWLCECKCGNVRLVRASSLKEGTSKSCGCRPYEYDGKGTGTKPGSLTQALRKNSTSGYKGVSQYKDTGKFQAYIYLKGKRYYLGSYDNVEEAAEARHKAEIELFNPILEEFGREPIPDDRIDQLGEDVRELVGGLRSGKEEN